VRAFVRTRTRGISFVPDDANANQIGNHDNDLDAFALSMHAHGRTKVARRAVRPAAGSP
jgi:hypothetical protein